MLGVGGTESPKGGCATVPTGHWKKEWYESGSHTKQIKVHVRDIPRGDARVRLHAAVTGDSKTREGLVAMFTPVYGGTTVKGGIRTKKMLNYCPVLCQARQGELRRLLIPY